MDHVYNVDTHYGGRMLREYLITLHDANQQPIGTAMIINSLSLQRWQQALRRDDVDRMAITVDALVRAAERHGGICNLRHINGYRRFRDAIQDGYLWYNDDGTTTNGHGQSTHCIAISKNF